MSMFVYVCVKLDRGGKEKIGKKRERKKGVSVNITHE